MKIIDPKLSFKSLTYNNKPAMWIIHHALHNNCTIQDVHRWHLNNGWAGCGYHFFIRKNGEIYKGRPVTANGGHTVGRNAISIGVCLEGCYTDYLKMTEKTVPRAQIEALANLINKYDNGRYKNLSVRYHREFAAKDCPGKYFPTAEFTRLLKNGVEVSKLRKALNKGSKYPEDWEKAINSMANLPTLVNNINSDWQKKVDSPKEWETFIKLAPWLKTFIEKIGE